MARFFNAADTQYGTLSFAGTNTAMGSMWVKADTESGMIAYFAATLGNSLANSSRRLQFDGGGLIRMWHNNNFNYSYARVGGFIAGQWNHILFGWSGNAAHVRVNGGTPHYVGTSSSSSGADECIIGAINASNYGGLAQFSTIHVAEFAMWNITQVGKESETYLLSQGYSPLFVRPNNLLVYMPVMGRSAKEPDLIRGGSIGITLYNDPQPSNDHPPIIYPRSGITNVSGLTTVFPPDPEPDVFHKNYISSFGDGYSIV